MKRSNSFLRLLLPAVAGLFLVSSVAWSAASTDQELADEVVSAVRRYSFFDMFDWVTVNVENGAVTLEGSVREPLHKTGYEQVAARVPGVKNVVNMLTVQPFSASDDDIRMAAARALYTDRSLQRLMLQAHPAIHVIVENGNVRLEGVVRTPMERALAATAVRRNTLAFQVVNNLAVEMPTEIP